MTRMRLLLVLLALVLIIAACGDSGQAGAPGEGSAAGTSDSGDGAADPAESTDANPGADSGSDVAAGGEDGDGSEADSASPALRPLPPAGGIPDPVDRGPLPVGLRIPDLRIDNSPIRDVGVEENGDFEVPKASEVGWYRFGSGPGQTGSTVMAAHINFDGEDGVFRYLDRIETGALVEVVLDNGEIVQYEIVEKQTYDKLELPFDEIFSEEGPDRLVLITCGGDFNPALRSYDSNVVAYAQPVA